MGGREGYENSNILWTLYKEVPPTVAVLGLKDGFFNRKLQQNIGGSSQGQSGSKIGGNSPLEAPFKRARVKTCLLRNETAHTI